ncbi:hypothetical protein CYY_000900 [Polysphondylium violaceum]|uniref:Uncharacterized protein n=1 Tax=Polysphondylium violaceum TaxID=133409 RepID=A0A8J4Q2R6_9MYCE|nr:hypothetical protein CYY_000900 [Polysphondylium violaceum]
MTSNNVINNHHGNGGQMNQPDMPTEALRQASQLIFDMDDWIKSELNMLEKFYLTDYQDVPFERAINKAKRKFEKRRGPTLIKPLNKRKNKMVVGNMEYDPITQIWKGNDNELVGFPNTPALITNLGKAEEKVVGNMKWDPNQKEWRGNESDLSKFRFLKPALITQLNSNLNPRVENGMVYDPVTMKWRGNEDVLDVFETMDDQNNDNTFTVGKEFNLSSSLIQEFSLSQYQHTKSLNGWFPNDRDLGDRDFLYSIRSMSIMQLVKSAHHTNGPSSGTSINGTASTIQPLNGPGIIPLNLNKKKPIVDETNDWDDVDFQEEKPALKLNLKVHLDQDDEMGMSDSENWDKEMGFTSEDDTLSSNNNDNGVMSSSSQPQTPRKVEEWSDFGDTSGSLSGKITQLSKFREAISNVNSNGKISSEEDDDLDWSGLEKNMKKGGSLKFPSANMSNIRNLHSIEKSFKRGGTLNNIPPIPNSVGGGGSSVGGGSTNNTPLSSSSSNIPNLNNNSNSNNNNNSTSMVGENYDDTFTVPKGAPLKIVHKPHSDNFDQFDEPCEETIRFFENDKDVVEEDWPDVQIPIDLGHKNSQESRKSPPIRNQVVEDYSDELDIPSVTEPLKLKKHLLIANPFGDDQDDETWDDVPFPADFRPSTPIQSLTTSTSKLAKPTTINTNPSSSSATSTKPTTTTTTTTTSNINNLHTKPQPSTFSTPIKDTSKSTSTTATTSNTVKSTPKINNIKPGDILSTPMSMSKLNTSTSTTAHLSPFTPLVPKSLDEILKTPDNDELMFDDDDDDDFFHSTPFKSRK